MSVDTLGTVHVFISGLSLCECDCVAQLYHVCLYFISFFFFFNDCCPFCTHFRGVPVTGK